MITDGMENADGAGSTGPLDGDIESDPDARDELLTADDELTPIKPYIFDPADVPVAARVLDTAFEALIEGWEGWGAVERAIKTLEVQITDSCKRAISQIAARPLRLELQGKAGTTLDTSGGFGMTAVADVPRDEILLWKALVQQVARPAAVARLGDLLFSGRIGNVGDNGRLAARAYLEAVDARENDLSTTTYLVRGWSLSRSIRDTAIENEMLDEVQRRVDLLSAGKGSSRPGVLHPLLQVLCVSPSDSARIEGIRRHAQTALSTLAGQESRSHLISELASMRRRIAGPTATPEQLTAISREEVEGHVRGADGKPAAARVALLEAAARLATMRGLTDEARGITAEMQSIGVDALGLQRITASSSLPVWIPESYLADYTRGSSWHAGMILYCTDPNPPTGRLTDHRRSAAQSRGSLDRVLNTVILGHDGLPRTTLTTDDEKDQHHVAFSSRITAEYQGQLLAEALRRVAARYGIPDVEDLTVLITELGAGDPQSAKSLAKAFRYFWAGDYEAAIAVALPKIEASARSLLRELDEGIYRVQVSKSAGGYPGLHVLLTELEKLALDEDWAWFLRWLMLGPIGANLRNDYAHGFLGDVSPAYAALLLRAAALLITACPERDDERRTVRLLPAAFPPNEKNGILTRGLSWISGIAVRVHTGLQVRRLHQVYRNLD